LKEQFSDIFILLPTLLSLSTSSLPFSLNGKQFNSSDFSNQYFIDIQVNLQNGTISSNSLLKYNGETITIPLNSYSFCQLVQHIISSFTERSPLNFDSLSSISILEISSTSTIIELYPNNISIFSIISNLSFLIPFKYLKFLSFIINSFEKDIR
jgi:hypothetical protein